MNILWKKPKDFQYLYLDMNAYFASVEQQENPHLRFKPIAITPTICPNGCIISPSYEARLHGVKTGMNLKDAKIICPQIIFRSSNTHKYMEYHHKIINIIKNLSPFYYIKSIDELLIKLSTQEKNFTNSLQLAHKIKKEIKKHIGEFVKCSIGISANSFLAKTAAESKKPDGLTILELKNIKNFYKTQKLTDLCGINWRMQNSLNKLNIYTPFDFFNLPIQTLKQSLGKNGEYWFLKLHGYDIEQFQHIKQKLISQSHVLEPRFRSWHLAWPICQKLVYKAAYRLRKLHSETKKIFLAVIFLGGDSWKLYLKIPSESDSVNLSKYVKSIWKKIPKFTHSPLKIIIAFTNLHNKIIKQINLFDDNSKQTSITNTIDLLNERYKYNIIYPSTILSAKESAPDRISFGRPNI